MLCGQNIFPSPALKFATGILRVELLSRDFWKLKLVFSRMQKFLIFFKVLLKSIKSFLEKNQTRHDFLTNFSLDNLFSRVSATISEKKVWGCH